LGDALASPTPPDTWGTEGWIHEARLRQKSQGRGAAFEILRWQRKLLKLRRTPQRFLADSALLKRFREFVPLKTLPGDFGRIEQQ
jgi:hypothetical protein